jgi:hypothetical protein
MLAVWLAVSPTSAYAAAPRQRAPVAALAATERPLPVGALGAASAGLVLGAAMAFGRRRSR